MNPIETWVDPDEIKRLTERLMQPSRQTQSTAHESGFNDSFVGFVKSDTFDSPSDFISISSTPPLQAETPRIEAGASGKSLGESMDMSKFAKWLHENCDASNVFSINQDGKTIYDEDAYHLHFAAQGMAINWKNRDNMKPVRIAIHSGMILELVPLIHPRGKMILGIIVPSPIPPSMLATIYEMAAKL